MASSNAGREIRIKEESIMDIKAVIEDLVKKLKLDTALMDRFKKDPLKAVEETLGVKLPEDQLKAVTDGVSAKLSLDQAGDTLDKVKGLFGG
jgi:hypothetical protein